MPTNLTSSIELIFRGTNLVGAAVAGALRDVDRFQAGVQTAVAPIALLTTGVLALEAAGARFALSFGKDAFDASIEFGRAQTELKKVLGEADGDVEDFTAQVFELSNQFAVSATDTLGAIASWKQAGFTAKEAGDLTLAGLKLVIAGDLEAADATELLIRSIRGFGLSVDEATPFLDVLNGISNNFGVTLGQLGEGMARIAPIAANLGFSYEEIAGFLTPVIEQTQSAEIASRGLKGAFLNLSNPSGVMADRLAELGVATRDSDGNLRSVKEILIDLAPAFSDLTTEQKANTAAILGGKENVAALSIALAEMDRAARATATGIAAIGTSIDNEVNARFESAAVLVDRYNVALENLKITLGRQFQVQLAGVADGFGEIFRELARLGESGGLDRFFAEVNPRLIEIERIAREVAAALPQALADADFSGFGDGIDALFGDLNNITIDNASLTEFITGVAEGFNDLAEFTSGVVDIFKTVADVVGPVITGFGELDESTQNALVTIGGSALVISIFGGALTGLIGVLKAAGLAYVATEARILAMNAAALASGGALGKGAIAAGALAKAAAAAAGVAGVGLLTFELTKMTGAGEAAAEALEPIFDPFFNFIDRYLININGIDEAGRDAARGLTELEQSAKSLTQLDAQPLGGFSTELDRLLARKDPTVDGLTEIDRLINEIATGPTAELTPLDLTGTIPSIEPLKNYIAAYDEAGNVIPGTLKKISDSAKKNNAEVAESVDQAIAKSEEFQLKLLEIASNERIQIIKSRFEFDIARLDADTRQIEAAFSSIDNTVTSTGDLIGDLFGSLEGLTRFDQSKVFAQIEREDRRRAEALALQARLVEAQIAKIKAQTKQLRQGKALIQVDASPLSPHLQNILHEILAQIQLKASGDLQEFLLNVDPNNPVLPV